MAAQRFAVRVGKGGQAAQYRDRAALSGRRPVATFVDGGLAADAIQRDGGSQARDGAAGDRDLHDGLSSRASGADIADREAHETSLDRAG
ncbi:hypothetical protein DIE12_33680 [Burkholderia sp. Bp9015]|nr:hypothetical protein DIE20_27110 [Burkholderia sp. Bp9131]RQR63501.1 hypothetical protein DIE12_33680 [Burkholderia sp. Bp9015]RQS29761.1 hypothetical protein DIE05_12165 [Burkholderia sp. Bp8995]RQS47857.1 hypothetical protein DIE00_12745 [Burkholderia sp. Bp8989]